MLKKQYRLTTKDINYILKRRQIIATPDFVFFYIPQYPNRPYNQFAIQISSKLHKRSVRRNKLKRMYYDSIEKNNLIMQKIHKTNGFIKAIALPHKKDIEQRHKLLDTKSRDMIQKSLSQSLAKI